MAKRGRPLVFEKRLNLAIPGDICDRLDATLSDGETRLDAIRLAIRNELYRRESAPKAPPDAPQTPEAPGKTKRTAKGRA